MAPVDFSGLWKQVGKENEEVFAKTLGIPDEFREKATSFMISQDITQDGDSFHVIATTPEGTVDVHFVAGGESFEAMTPRGKRKAFAQWDGSLLVTTTETPEMPMKVTRELVGNEMHMVLRCGEAWMKIIFKKE